jgi:hypothetical protein
VHGAGQVGYRSRVHSSQPRSEWSRPYTPGAGRRWIIVWEAGALAYLHWTTVRLFGLGTTASLVLGAAFVVLWVVGSWRINRMGVYVNHTGVLVRGLVFSRTLPWARVERIIVRSARIGGRQVLIDLRDGSTVKTSLWEQGVDFHHRRAVFRSVCQELRERHRAATAPAPVPILVG